MRSKSKVTLPGQMWYQYSQLVELNQMICISRGWGHGKWNSYLIDKYEILGTSLSFKLEYLPLIRKFSNLYQTKLPESKFILKKFTKIFQLIPKLLQF